MDSPEMVELAKQRVKPIDCVVVRERGEMIYGYPRHSYGSDKEIYIGGGSYFVNGVFEGYRIIEKLNYSHPFLKIQDKIFRWDKCDPYIDRIYEIERNRCMHFDYCRKVKVVPKLEYLIAAPYDEIIKEIKEVEIERDGKRMVLNLEEEYQKYMKAKKESEKRLREAYKKYKKSYPNKSYIQFLMDVAKAQSIVRQEKERKKAEEAAREKERKRLEEIQNRHILRKIFFFWEWGDFF
ncbi:MAG: hypothetical protein H7A25_22510 [Leptospiraceae bacterium]|nr:hypothetical protein [Leptospiraceae bacterium]MCP5502688.1 hypothetical protein [Leptospiraceae bacterium]